MHLHRAGRYVCWLCFVVTGSLYVAILDRMALPFCVVFLALFFPYSTLKVLVGR